MCIALCACGERVGQCTRVRVCVRSFISIDVRHISGHCRTIITLTRLYI